MTVWCNDPTHEAERVRALFCWDCGGPMRPTGQQSATNGERYQCADCGLNAPILTALRHQAVRP